MLETRRCGLATKVFPWEACCLMRRCRVEGRRWEGPSNVNEAEEGEGLVRMSLQTTCHPIPKADWVPPRQPGHSWLVAFWWRCCASTHSSETGVASGPSSLSTAFPVDLCRWITMSINFCYTRFQLRLHLYTHSKIFGPTFLVRYY